MNSTKGQRFINRVVQILAFTLFCFLVGVAYYYLPEGRPEGATRLTNAWDNAYIALMAAFLYSGVLLPFADYINETNKKLKESEKKEE